MDNQSKKCKGITKKGKPCNKFPLVGEEYCERHHPIKSLKRKIKILTVTFSGIIIMLLLFILGQYLSYKSTESIKSEYKKHSFAERIISNQYNPIKLQEYLEEFFNLMNADPNFKKTFFVDSHGISIQAQDLLYNENFRIDFSDTDTRANFEKFVGSGQRSFLLEKGKYKCFYILKDGGVIDSVKNKTFAIGRNFPIFPMINISTVGPTGEYLCTNLLDIQIDSIANNNIYMSNIYQNSTFKVKLSYDLIKKTAKFDQIKDINFDSESVFYSIDQEISYYNFWHALLSNAKIRIRNAATGDSILTSEHFVPSNIDGGQSFENVINKLSFLNNLKIVENRWGKSFSSSNITSIEFEYLKAISDSYRNGSEVTEYPFKFSLPEVEARKIIDRKNEISKRTLKIICNKYSIILLGEFLQLGQLQIIIPPSSISHKNQNDYVLFQIAPKNRNENIIFKFPEISKDTRPGNTIYGDTHMIWKNDKIFVDSTAVIVKDLILDQESWYSTKPYEGKYAFDD